MNPRNRQVAIRWMVALASGLVASPAFADWGALNMPEGVTPISRDVYGLHMTILWICAVIGVVVFGAMLISILRHRKSRGVKPAQFHHNTAIEIVWTIIPLGILISMAVPATRVLIDMEDTTGADMTVKVTGYQWKWEYEYLDEDIRFFSNLDENSNAARQVGAAVDPASVDNYLLEVDRRLVVPTNTRIRFLITSNDVIHSWWVPELGWKRDAIPGYVNASWTEIEEPGVYRGQCAELCGRDHAFMPVVIEAKTPEEYQKWVAAQKGDSGGGAEADAAAAETPDDDRVAAR